MVFFKERLDCNCWGRKQAVWGRLKVQGAGLWQDWAKLEKRQSNREEYVCCISSIFYYFKAVSNNIKGRGG